MGGEYRAYLTFHVNNIVSRYKQQGGVVVPTGAEVDKENLPF